MQRKYSVSQFIQEMASYVNQAWGGISLTGEIAQFTRASSGHWYFTLKDERAQIRAVMFRQRNISVGFLPRQGDQVEVVANASVYEARGELQLVCESLRKAGTGNLFEQYVLLKDRLFKEGLFDPARKKALVPVAFSIGVVTSPQAAAWADIQTALQRRIPHARVVLYPTSVQGEAAKAQIVKAIAVADTGKHDVLIIGRGGGSLEDLWCFNEEVVVKAVSACNTPTVVGVGHESDFTLAELAADLRAATPTAAVELCSRSTEQIRHQISVLYEALAMKLSRRLEQMTQKIDRCELSIVTPEQRVSDCEQLLESMTYKMVSRLGLRVTLLDQQLDSRIMSMKASARYKLARNSERLIPAQAALKAGALQRFDRTSTSVERLEQVLEAVSPARNLKKGYAFIQSAQTQEIVSSIDQVEGGSTLVATVSDGQLELTVSSKKKRATDSSVGY